MKRSPERILLAIVIGVSAVTAIGLAAAARWPVGRPFPPLAYAVVAPATASLALAALGFAGLATAALVGRGARAGWWLMLSGLVWDAICQAAGLSSGQAGAGAMLGVDALLMAYVAARSALFDR